MKERRLERIKSESEKTAPGKVKERFVVDIKTERELSWLGEATAYNGLRTRTQCLQQSREIICRD